MDPLSGPFGQQCWISGYQALGRHKTDSSDGAATVRADDNLYREPEPLYASRMDNMDVLLSELEHDVSIVNQDYRSGKNGNMVSLLHIAAQEGNLDIVKVLIEKGADIDRGLVHDGFTPLLSAVLNGHFKIAQFLISKGALLDKAAEDGSTPLYMAAHKGNIRVVKLLLEAGADPKASGSIINVSPPLSAATNIAKDPVIANMIKKAIKEREVIPVEVDSVSFRVSGHKNQYVSGPFMI